MATIDTLQIYERLRKAKGSDNLAKEIAEIFRETVEEKLATKNDIKILELQLKNEMARTKSETIKWVAGMLLAQAGLITTLMKIL